MSALSCSPHELSRQEFIDIQAFDQQRTQAPLSQQELPPSLVAQPVPHSSTSQFYPMSTGLVKDLQLFSPESISSIESPRYVQSMFSDQSTLFDTRYHGNDYEGSISFGSGAASFYDHIPSASGVYHDENNRLATGFYSPAPTVLDSGDEIKNSQFHGSHYDSNVQNYTLAQNSPNSSSTQDLDSYNGTQNLTSNPSSLLLDSHVLQQGSPQLPQLPQSPAISNSSLERAPARRTRNGLRRKLSTGKNVNKGDAVDETTSTISSPTSARKRRASSITKGDKPKVPKLNRPLSELTKDYNHLPIKNMEVWVTRSLEERRREVEKRNGYITRPMNSFMLYRSAYAERTKFWCLQNNHQVVSSVSGASWPLEPPAIRDRYNAYAKHERMNHQRAHPGYKFSPAKVQTMACKLDKTAEQDDDDVQISSDLEDVDLGSGKITKARKREKSSTGKSQQFTGHVTTPVAEDVDNLDVESPGGALKSSYETLNPGRIAPKCMGNTDMNGSYYQTIVRPSSGVKLTNAMIEDVTIKKTAAPAGQNDLRREMHERLLASSIESTTDSKVDPTLLGHSNDIYLTNSEGSEEEQEYAFDLKYYTNIHSHSNNFETDPLFHSGDLGSSYVFLPDGGKASNCFSTYNDDSINGILNHHKSWSQIEEYNRTHDDAGHHINMDEWLE